MKNKLEQLAAMMGMPEFEKMAEYAKADVMMMGDMVDRGPSEEELTKAKEPLSFLKGGDSRQFLNMPTFAKLAFWSFLKAIAGVTTDLEIRSFRLLGDDIYIRTQRDVEGTVGEATFKVTKAEAEFCCGLQYANQASNLHHFSDFFEAAIANQKAGVNKVRPEFLLAALNLYKQMFSIMEYADEPGIKEKFEFFKAQANTVDLSQPLDLMEEFPAKVDRQMRKEEEARSVRHVMISDTHMPGEQRYDDEGEEDSGVSTHDQAFKLGFAEGMQNQLYKLREELGEIFDKIGSVRDGDQVMHRVIDHIDQEIDVIKGKEESV